MNDPALDLQMREITILMSELKSFRDIVVSTLNTEVVVPENEERLTRIKETVPGAAQKLYSQLFEDYDGTAEKIVNRISNLSLLIKFTDLEKRKLLETWHKYYMQLYYMLGMLQVRKEKIESLNISRQKLRRFLLSPVTITVILAAIVLLVFILLSR